MAEKLNADTIKRISELTTVKKISDLQTIPIIENVNGTYVTTQQYENSYLLSSTYFPDNTSYGRYINYKVKISDVTYYLSTLGSDDLNSFKASFNNFINNLCENTAGSYVQLVQDKDSIDKEYSYTFKYQLSQVIPNEVIAFSYSYIEGTGEQLSTYAYTNALKPGLVNHETLEQYVRSAISRILGVPSSPAELSYAIDSVIEFVDWFKGYVRDDTSYGSLQNLINTIESKDDKVLNSTYSYVIQNKELSYAYTETSYNKLYNTLNNLNIKPIAGTNISIGEDNSVNCDIGIGASETFTVGGVKYSLQFEDGKFSIAKTTNPYSSFTFTEQSGTSNSEEFEYNSADGTITIIGKPNKTCKITTLDNVSGNYNDSQIVKNTTEILANETVTVTGSYQANKTTTFTIGATMSSVANDGGFTPTEKSITKTISFNKYKVGVFASSLNTIDISENDNNQPNPITSYGGSWQTVSSLPNSFGSFQINSNNGDCYIYFLVPTSWTSSSKGFKWRGTETLPETPGSNNIDNKLLYGNSVPYKLYRSGNKYPSGTSINMKYTA